MECGRALGRLRKKRKNKTLRQEDIRAIKNEIRKATEICENIHNCLREMFTVEWCYSQ